MIPELARESAGLERFTLGLQTILGFRPGQPGSVRTGCTQSEGKPL
jgi:hypothetical protein